MKNILIRVGICAIIVFLLVAFSNAEEEDRTFHPVAIDVIVKENPANWSHLHTHVETTGFVTYVKKEADGDSHVRLCDAATVKGMDRQHCIVIEFIPELRPAVTPKKGQTITVQGISRYDAESNHNWWELHPALSFKVKK